MRNPIQQLCSTVRYIALATGGVQRVDRDAVARVERRPLHLAVLRVAAHEPDEVALHRLVELLALQERGHHAEKRVEVEVAAVVDVPLAHDELELDLVLRVAERGHERGEPVPVQRHARLAVVVGLAVLVEHLVQLRDLSGKGHIPCTPGY